MILILVLFISFSFSVSNILIDGVELEFWSKEVFDGKFVLVGTYFLSFFIFPIISLSTKKNTFYNGNILYCKENNKIRNTIVMVIYFLSYIPMYFEAPLRIAL